MITKTSINTIAAEWIRDSARCGICRPVHPGALRLPQVRARGARGLPTVLHHSGPHQTENPWSPPHQKKRGRLFWFHNRFLCSAYEHPTRQLSHIPYPKRYRLIFASTHFVSVISWGILARMNYADSASVPFFQPLDLFLLLPLFGLVIIWSLSIKGFALWKSARNGHKTWFVFMLIVNSLGILELIYLIWFSKETSKVAPTPAPSALS